MPSEPRAGDVPRMPSGSRAAGEASGRRAAGETGGTSGSPQMRFYRVAREQLDAAAAGFLGAPLRCLACEALERDGFQAADPEEIDAVVVPLVAFDDAGRRLGYGGGNYDQLLPRLRADAVVIGIAFDEQRVETVPCEPHDIALPRVAPIVLASHGESGRGRRSVQIDAEALDQGSAICSGHENAWRASSATRMFHVKHSFASMSDRVA